MNVEELLRMSIALISAVAIVGGLLVTPLFYPSGRRRKQHVSND